MERNVWKEGDTAGVMAVVGERVGAARLLDFLPEFSAAWAQRGRDDRCLPPLTCPQVSPPAALPRKTFTYYTFPQTMDPACLQVPGNVATRSIQHPYH